MILAVQLLLAGIGAIFAGLFVMLGAGAERRRAQPKEPGE